MNHHPAISALDLDWATEKNTLQTSSGSKTLNFATIRSESFWKIWQREKEDLKELGYSPTRRPSGEWVLNQWVPVDGFPKPPAPEVEKPIPDGHIDPAGLLAWQRQAVARIVRAIKTHGICLDASDVGTGKTYSALAAFKHLGLSPLVICPLAVIPSWIRAADHFGIKIECVNYEKIRRGNGEFCELDSGKRFFTFSRNVGSVIFDEVHRCKSQTSLNSKLLIAAARQKLPTLCLSATAFVSPVEMKALGFLLKLYPTLGGFYSWAFENGCKLNSFKSLEYAGSRKILAAIHASIFPTKGCRVRVRDLGDAFPETFITTQPVTVTAAGARKINDAIAVVRDLISRKERAKIEAATLAASGEILESLQEKIRKDSDSILTALLRARQISEVEKLAALADIVGDGVEQGCSVVVFLNFRDSVDTLVFALSTLGLISVVQGGQKPEERAQSIDDFQSGKSRILIANIDAGGVGISLHDLTGDRPRLALVSPSWSAVAMRQALGRVHRAGGKSKSVQRILFAAGTIEEEICQKVEAKLSNLDILNDGDLL